VKRRPVWAKLQCYAARLVAVNVGREPAESPARKKFNAGIAFASTARPIPRVLQSPFPIPTWWSTYGLDWVPPQDFHNLWKRLWKSTRALSSWTPGQVNCLCVKYFQA